MWWIKTLALVNISSIFIDWRHSPHLVGGVVFSPITSTVRTKTHSWGFPIASKGLSLPCSNSKKTRDLTQAHSRVFSLETRGIRCNCKKSRLGIWRQKIRAGLIQNRLFIVRRQLLKKPALIILTLYLPCLQHRSALLQIALPIQGCLHFLCRLFCGNPVFDSSVKNYWSSQHQDIKAVILTNGYLPSSLSTLLSNSGVVNPLVR